MNAQAITRSLEAAGVDRRTIDKFLAWHTRNPHVWRFFETFALKAIAAGQKLGAKAIAERVRWEVAVERGEDFKVNNNFPAYYARVFALKHPAHRDYFETRTLRGLK